VPTKTWRQKALSTTPPPVQQTHLAIPDVTYNSSTNKVLYHVLDIPADYEYDPVADTWKRLVSVGGGATADPVNPDNTPGQVMVYDAGRNVLVGFNQVVGGSKPEAWQGILPAASTSAGAAASACDLNADGVINSTDVQLAINQALGVAACKSADLIGSGTCTVADVQRIINASLGQSCRTGM
jgi:hypothetical protein